MKTQKDRTKYDIEEGQPIPERPADRVKELDKYYEKLREIRTILKNKEDLQEENSKTLLYASFPNLPYHFTTQETIDHGRDRFWSQFVYVF